MTSPKHLWSGDWEDESEAAQSSLPAPPPEPPAAPPPPEEPPRATPGLLRPRIVILTLVVLLIAAGAVYALTSGSSNHARKTDTTTNTTGTGTSTGAPTSPSPTQTVPPAFGPGTGTVPGVSPGTPQSPSTPQSTGTTATPSSGPQADALGLQLSLVPVDKVVVSAVVPGSLAAQDIGAGDELLSVNGTKVTSPDQANAIIAKIPKGSVVTLQLVQGSALITATLQESNGP
jgi:hypothetical protein